MKTMKSKITGLIAVFFLIACVSVFAEGGQDSSSNPSGTEIVLYFVGCYNNMPCYWQNAVRRNLSVPSGTYGVANAITVGDDGTVYISGYYVDRYYDKPCYWQNGVRKDLPIPSGAVSCQASAITVGTDGTVYILGNYRLGNYDDGYLSNSCYWQDRGGRIGIYDSLLPAGALSASGEAITVGADGTVYISGYYNDRNYNGKPCYWQNGRKIDLPVPSDRNNYSVSASATAFASASAIALGADGTVYIVGYTGFGEGNIADFGTPCYWQNGVRKELSPGVAFPSHRFNIVVGANRTVYIAGPSCYWQDGVRKDMPVPDDVFLRNFAIAVGTDGTVYVGACYYYDEYSQNVVCYWQGDIRYDIGTLERSEFIESQFIVVK